jgi:hypothetical protein
METAHVMLAPRTRPRRNCARAVAGPLLLLLTLPLLLAACETTPLPAPETEITSPYAARPVVFAVAPLVNESGVGVVDELRVTDTLINQLEQVAGLTALPTNRTLAAMRALAMPEVASPEDAWRLAHALDADAIIVGSISAWDPYRPPRLGLILDLYARTPAVAAADLPVLDPGALRVAATDADLDAERYRRAPVASYSRYLDASAGDVSVEVQAYAVGRHDPESPFGWRLYLQSMTRFTEFACFQAVRGLLSQEARRVAIAEATPQTPR